MIGVGPFDSFNGLGRVLVMPFVGWLVGWLVDLYRPVYLLLLLGYSLLPHRRVLLCSSLQCKSGRMNDYTFLLPTK